MIPITLNRLLEMGGVNFIENGLIVTISPSWILEGEDRLSYTALIRLIECCRELHWNIDILSTVKDISVDSITKSIVGEFIRPIQTRRRISITYQVTEVYQKGYLLKFRICDVKKQTLYAKFELISIFYDPLMQKSVYPPASVSDNLKKSNRFDKQNKEIRKCPTEQSKKYKL